MHSICSSRQDGLQRRWQLTAKHCLGQTDTHSGLDGNMLLKKEPAEVVLHRACGVLDQGLLQLSDIAFGPTICGGVTRDRCNSLDTVSFVECSDLVGHKHCAIVTHHPRRNAKRHKERTQHTDDHC